jgi:hypothetical protein
MTPKTKERTPKPKCRDCGGTDEVIDGLCAECEEHCVHCDVCEEWHSTEGDVCRHVFWTDCGWAGAGTYEGGWDAFRGPFWAFLDAMAEVESPDLDDYPDLVTGIEVELARDAFFTRLEGPMLGTPDLLFYRSRPDLHESVGSLSFARIGPYQVPRDDGEVADGFAWLQSLCADDTKEANRRTLGWIGEWRGFVAQGWRVGRRF